MATTSIVPFVAERGDIHKGCRSLETLVNVLNDYCEAASAIVTLQKKLTKALKEAAGHKCAGDIASNAFNASAAIFNALSEVDSKFAKVADKECESVSTEVRKWFKELSKEEKAHDKRLANANDRIKQAGHLYEKKASRNPRDVEEEHARYINLLSTLGPEITQAKYNHALLVSQRYTATTYSVAACLSRIADAEWLRTCEGTRRFAPVVGQLGEWRALCEGGWTAAPPVDLPDIGGSPEQNGQVQHESQRQQEPRAPGAEVVGRPEREPGKNDVLSAPPTSLAPDRTPPPQYHTPLPTKESRPPSSHGHSVEDDRSQPPTVRSVASLAAFPAPPTHFPLPPVNGARSSESDSSSPAPSRHDIGSDPQQSQNSSSISSTAFPALPSLTESPREERPPETAVASGSTPASQPSRDNSQGLEKEEAKETETQYTDKLASKDMAGGDYFGPKQEAEKPASNPRRASVYKAGDYLADRELGMQPSGTQNDLKSKSLDTSKRAQEVQRSNSVVSTGSVVQSLKTRYDRTTAPSSPPPKDLPRLSLSVSDLANKYEPGDKGLASPRQRATSPPAERPPPVPENGTVRTVDSRATDRSSASGPAPVPRSNLDDLTLRRQRLAELEELEIREKEYELRAREREIEEQARALERDRARILGARVRRESYTGDSTTGRGRTSSHDPRYDGSAVVPHNRYSFSAVNLGATSAPQSPLAQHPKQNSRSRPTTPTTAKPVDHAPSCGCDRCSIVKYRSPDPATSPRDTRPPSSPIVLRPEKPKGWIRRLSMPVIAGLDSKKDRNASGAFASARNSMTIPEEDGGFGFGRTNNLRADMTGGISNRSVTNFGRR